VILILILPLIIHRFCDDEENATTHPSEIANFFSTPHLFLSPLFGSLAHRNTYQQTNTHTHTQTQKDIDKETIDVLAPFNKPYIVSLSGLSLEDNLAMLDKALQTPGIASIELNLACPNVPGKPIIAYDFEQMETVLQAITQHPLLAAAAGDGGKSLGVKLAPYFDVPHFQRAVSIIAKFPAIKYVVSINTIGNALFVDAQAECASIVPKGGFGGLGGGYVKQTALANVRQLSLALGAANRSDIDVIGVGGVSSGTDAFELILCGAKAVQVATCHWTEGPGCFARIASELEALMKEKGYRSIEDFRGKLKPFEKHASHIATKSGKVGGAAAAAAAAAAGSTGATISKGGAMPSSAVLMAIVVLLVAVAYVLGAKLGTFGLL